MKLKQGWGEIFVCAIIARSLRDYGVLSFGMGNAKIKA